MSTTDTPPATDADRVRQLEAELAALRENSARAHRQLHEAMADEIAALNSAHQDLHRAHARLRVERELERLERQRQSRRVIELRANLVRVRRERNAALAAARHSPARRVIAVTQQFIVRASRGLRTR